MFTEEMIHNAMASLGELTKEQIDTLKEALNKKGVNTEELRQQLKIAKEPFDNFLIALEEGKKKKVFEAEVSPDEMEAVAGGKIVRCNKTVHLTCEWAHVDLAYPDNCRVETTREIYGGNGFPNCAATVNDGSNCYENDACFSYSVHYNHMRECHRSWQ